MTGLPMRASRSTNNTSYQLACPDSCPSRGQQLLGQHRRCRRRGRLSQLDQDPADAAQDPACTLFQPPPFRLAVY